MHFLTLWNIGCLILYILYYTCLICIYCNISMYNIGMSSICDTANENVRIRCPWANPDARYRNSTADGLKPDTKHTWVVNVNILFTLNGSTVLRRPNNLSRSGQSTHLCWTTDFRTLNFYFYLFREKPNQCEQKWTLPYTDCNQHWNTGWTVTLLLKTWYKTGDTYTRCIY